VDAPARDMRQREVRIFRNRPVEGLVGAMPGRQDPVDPIAIKRRRTA
jgi:hypothetical protein